MAPLRTRGRKLNLGRGAAKASAIVGREGEAVKGDNLSVRTDGVDTVSNIFQHLPLNLSSDGLVRKGVLL